MDGAWLSSGSLVRLGAVASAKVTGLVAPERVEFAAMQTATEQGGSVTLALHGKSGKRKLALVLAAVLAVVAGTIGGVAFLTDEVVLAAGGPRSGNEVWPVSVSGTGLHC